MERPQSFIDLSQSADSLHCNANTISNIGSRTAVAFTMDLPHEFQDSRSSNIGTGSRPPPSPTLKFYITQKQDVGEKCEHSASLEKVPGITWKRPWHHLEDAPASLRRSLGITWQSPRHHLEAALASLRRGPGITQKRPRHH